MSESEDNMTLLGEGIGITISKMQQVVLVILTGGIMGIVITVAEPDLQVLISQFPSIPNYTLLVSVAVGVFFLALAIMKVLCHIRLSGY